MQGQEFFFLFVLQTSQIIHQPEHQACLPGCCGVGQNYMQISLLTRSQTIHGR